MSIEPVVVNRPSQPYIGLRYTVPMSGLASVAAGFPVLFEWLRERGVDLAGAPFFKYDVIDMQRQLTVEAGVPVTALVEATGDIVAGTLPAGRYATTTHVGHPDELVGVIAELLEWARARGETWDLAQTPDGEQWGCRLEIYKTDPAQQPDMSRWEVELAFRLAD